MSPIYNPATTTAQIAIYKNGTLVGTRPTLNIIEGSNTSITVADNAGSNRVDATFGAGVAPAYVGTSNGSGQINGTNSVLTFTTGRAIAAGEQVMVATANAGGSQNTSTISVGALSLARDLNGPHVTKHLELWSARASSLISSGVTVTITLPSAVTSHILGLCASFTGIANSSYLDVSATGTGTSLTPTTSATATTTVANSVSVAALCQAGAGSAAPGTGYTEIVEVDDTTSGAPQLIQMEYKILSATGAQTATWTTTGNASYDALVQVYEGGV
jgi:hypothetical protein